MLIYIFKCIVLSVTLYYYAAEGEVGKHRLRANESEINLQYPTAGTIAAAKSALQKDVDRVQMAFDNFQALLSTGRAALGLPASGPGAEDHTGVMRTSTVKYNENNPKMPSTESTTSKQRMESVGKKPTLTTKQSPPLVPSSPAVVSPPEALNSSVRASPSPSTERVTYAPESRPTVTYTPTPNTATASINKEPALDDNGRYFTQFYPQLLKLLSQKTSAEVSWLKDSICASIDVYHSAGELKFLSVLDDQLVAAAGYIRDLPGDQLQEMAKMADKLFNPDQFTDDTRELIDFLNYIYEDKDADRMSLILYNILHHDEQNHTENVGEQAVHWLILSPLQRISADAPLLRAFIDVAMTFIERLKRPGGVRRAVPWRQRGEGRTERESQIEFTPLNLRSNHPKIPKKQREKPNRQIKPRKNKGKYGKESIADARVSKNHSKAKQRRFQIVRREGKKRTRDNGEKNKMAVRDSKNTIISKKGANIFLKSVDVTIRGPEKEPTDNLRKYLYDSIKRIIYKN